MSGQIVPLPTEIPHYRRQTRAHRRRHATLSWPCFLLYQESVTYICHLYTHVEVDSCRGARCLISRVVSVSILLPGSPGIISRREITRRCTRGTDGIIRRSFNFFGYTYMVCVAAYTLCCISIHKTCSGRYTRGNELFPLTALDLCVRRDFPDLGI